MRRRRAAVFAGVAFAAYVAAYAGYRHAHLERWERDGRDYVLYGSRAVYLLFRPMSHADQALTGAGAHLGPHR